MNAQLEQCMVVRKNIIPVICGFVALTLAIVSVGLIISKMKKNKDAKEVMVCENVK